MRRESLVDVVRCCATDLDYQQLMEIAGVDYPERPERFEVVYCLLSADARTTASGSMSRPTRTAGAVA